MAERVPQDLQIVWDVLEKVNVILNKRTDFQNHLNKIVRLLGISINCDRVWLIHPKGHDSPNYELKATYSLPNFSGIRNIESSHPFEEDLSHLWPIVIERKQICKFSKHTPDGLSEKIIKDYGVLSLLVLPLPVERSNPWLLCLQQCSNIRDWTEMEEKIAGAVANRLSDRISIFNLSNQAKESERKLSETQQLACVGNWYWNVKTGEVEWSEEVFKIFKLDSQTFVPQIDSIMNMSPWPEEHGRDKELIEKAIASRKPGTYEQKFLKADGSIGYYYSSFQGEYDENGQLTMMKGTVQDITERKIAELVLLENEEKFSSYVEHAPFGIFVADEQGKYVEVNKLATEITGYSKAELLQMYIKDLFPADEQQNAQNHFATVVKTGVASGTLRFVRKDRIECIWTVDAVKLSNQRYLAFVNDVTQRVEAAEELKRINKAIQQSPVAVEITDLKGNIVYVNPKYTEMSGYLKEEVIGTKINLLDSKKIGNDITEEIWETLLAGKEWHGEFQNQKKTGELYWQDIVISAISNEKGELSNFVSVEEDITEKKKLWADLIEAKNKAEESDRLKSAFLANISHEIRTPMNGILGFSTLLLEPRMNEKEKDEYIHMIHKSGNRMLSIINDLIDISRIEAGEIQLHIEATKINSVIDELFLFFKNDAEKKDIHLSTVISLPDDDRSVLIDRTKVNQILTNLIQNALKYTRQGSVEFGCMLKDEQLEFYVKDSGIGVPSNLQEKIFDRFRRADSDGKYSYQGAGLGLSICKGFIKMMGGDIWVESTEGVGSTFYFTLPYNSSESREQECIAPLNGKVELNRPIRILIAEDDEASYLLLKKILTKKNIETLTVDNGQDAIDFIEANNDVDLILMDMKMPVMNGYAATRRIKECRPTLPIIGQSAFASPNERNKAIEAGCNDYISKPIHIDRLFALIEKHIHKKGAEQK